MRNRWVLGTVILELGIIAILGFWIYGRTARPEAIRSVAFEHSGYAEIPSSTARYFGIMPGPIRFKILFATRPQDPVPITDYILDRNGFNETQAYEVPKPPDTFRILAIGDSHTFGLFVDPEENYPARLEQILVGERACGKKIEVLNTGVPGHDAELVVEHLRRKGMILEPDLLLWWVKYDDLTHANAYFGPSSDMSKISEIGEGVLWNYSLEKVKGLRDLFEGPVVFIKGASLGEVPVLDELFERTLLEMEPVRMVAEPRLPEFYDGHPLPEGHARMARLVADLLRQEDFMCP